MFAGKGLKLGNIPVIEHEIHTKGPPIRQPYRRQNPEVRRQEQEQLKDMLEQEIVRPSCRLLFLFSRDADSRKGTFCPFCVPIHKKKKTFGS